MGNTEGAASWTAGLRRVRKTPKPRRCFAPEIAHTIDHEILIWSFNFKGLRGHDGAYDRHAIASLAGQPSAFHVALRDLEERHPHPPLVPPQQDALQRLESLERWFCDEVGPEVLVALSHSHGRAESDDPAGMILRALELIAGLTLTQRYLVGDHFSRADIAAASVLAPIARRDGWMWAGSAWSARGRALVFPELYDHAGARWVRKTYDRHAAPELMPARQSRAWVP